MEQEQNKKLPVQDIIEAELDTVTGGNNNNAVVAGGAAVGFAAVAGGAGMGYLAGKNAGESAGARAGARAGALAGAAARQGAPAKRKVTFKGAVRAVQAARAIANLK
jgi:hypothetical protein